MKKKKPDILGALLNAVALKYPEDKVRPGVVVSQLENGDIYASVRRYTEGVARPPLVGARVAGGESSVADAVRILAERFLYIASNLISPLDKALDTLGEALE